MHVGIDWGGRIVWDRLLDMVVIECDQREGRAEGVAVFEVADGSVWQAEEGGRKSQVAIFCPVAKFCWRILGPRAKQF
jgi:hypothetical protein